HDGIHAARDSCCPPSPSGGALITGTSNQSSEIKLYFLQFTQNWRMYGQNRPRIWIQDIKCIDKSGQMYRQLYYFCMPLLILHLQSTYNVHIYKILQTLIHLLENTLFTLQQKK